VTVLFSGCAGRGSVVPGAAQAQASPAVPQIVDEHGVLDSARAQAMLERVRQRASTDFLHHHLAHVEGALSAPLVLGNEARLLVDGPQTHAAMLEMIAAARDHINLETYILEDGEPGERFARALEEKRAQGVAVHVMFDSMGSLGTPREYIQRLRDADIAVCEFNPVNPLRSGSRWRLNNRDHRKILVVDGKVAFTGGINISSTYASSSFIGRSRAPSAEDGWRDTHVLVKGPAVARLQQLFVNSWHRWSCAPLGGLQFPRLAKEGDMAMRVVAADPLTGLSETYPVLLSAIRHARARVWLTYGYFVPDDEIEGVLCGAARRGVDVRLVLPGFSDFWLPLAAARAHYDTLLEAGVRIFERHDALLHAKTAVIDDVWSSVGSSNIDWRSFVHNFEADVVVIDPSFAVEMERLFRRDQAAAEEVMLDRWRQRGVAARFKEWFASRWEYLL
jgi:cardiolipin synthase